MIMSVSLPTAALTLAFVTMRRAAQAPPVLQLQESARIGSSDSENYALTFVGGVAVADGGTLFIMQPVEHMIRVYSPSGNFVRQIGRRGSGALGNFKH